MNYIKFEYWNDTDLGETLYQFGYKNRLILNIEIEKPEYNTTIEAEQNGDNAPITKFRKLEKVRKFETFVQEDLVDAFKFMAIHDNIEVTLRSGEVLTVEKHTMVIEHSWEEIGCLAKVTGSFVVDYITAGSCQTNFDLGCLCETVGEFEDIIEYSELAISNPAEVYLVWTVENIAGKKYTASLYYYSAGVLSWLPSIVPDQYSCYEDQTGGGTWIYDGQYWQLVPGYFALAQPSLLTTDILISGWWKVNFTDGNAPAPLSSEDVLGNTSTATAKVLSITLTGGSWAGNDAAGIMYFYDKHGVFQAEPLNFSGSGNCQILTDFTLIYPAWILPGSFITVEYRVSGAPAWTVGNDYTADELMSGITINPGLTGTYEVRLKVWNHSCDYGYTETESIKVI